MNGGDDENRRYFAAVARRNLVRSVLNNFRPRMLLVFLAIFCLFFVVYRTPAADWLALREHPNLVTAVVSAIFFFSYVGIVLWRNQRLQAENLAATFRALQSPGPDELFMAFESLFALVPALGLRDAYRACNLSFANAIYGRGVDAFRALEGVDWKSCAPLVRYAALDCEALVELVQFRNVHRALRLAQDARDHGGISGQRPAAKRLRQSLEMYVALAEVVGGPASKEAVAALQVVAADPAIPTNQLLASLGLAIACERTGETARAKQLREFIQRTAPHCAPLSLRFEDFASPLPRGEAPAIGPVSAALGIAEAPSSA